MDRPIRILHVIHGMDCGGAENMIMNLYRFIDRNKVQFDFLVHTQKKCYFDEEIKQLGGNIYNVIYYKGTNLISYRKAVNNFFQNNHNFKAVHGHVGSCAHIYLETAKKYGIFTIAHSHSINPSFFSLKNIMYKLGALRTRKIADYFFGCSNDAGRDRFGNDIVNGNKYHTFKNAIDAPKYSVNEKMNQAVRDEFGLNDKFVIGHIGSFNLPKNHEFLLKIFKIILQLDDECVLMLVGDGELKSQIEQQAIDLEIHNKIIMTGIRSDVHRLLQGMDCFVLPSLWEGFPLVIVEAQSAGLKCIISDKVPSECDITGNVEIIPLNVGEKTWAKHILAYKSAYKKENMLQTIIDAGFDIKDNTKWLQEFYLSLPLKGETNNFK
jgi:glycosyltransferase involved in cell wall biosynthesis